MPAHDECRDDGLIPTGRRAEEIDDRDLLVHHIQEPAVIRRVRVGAHECVVDNLVARVDLVMSLALILIPDPSTSSREDGLDAQQVCHLARLEDPALRVGQRNALAAELEAAREIAGIQHAASKDNEPVHVLESRLAIIGETIGHYDRQRPAASVIAERAAKWPTFSNSPSRWQK
jgi:hypothetical protein